MSYLECITNTIPDARPCVINGEHQEGCEDARNGMEFRYATVGEDEKGYPIYGYIETGKPCPGCVPKPAAVGMLCLHCIRRLEVVLAEWYVAEDVIAAHDVLIQRDSDGVRSRPDGYTTLPLTMLAVDEVRSYLRGAPVQIQAWVSTVDGATNAIRFTNAAQTALRTFPIEERRQPLKRMRCPNPVHGSYPPLVQWNPPKNPLEPVNAQCEECGHRITENERWTAFRKSTDGWEAYEQSAVDVIAEIETKKKSVVSVIEEETA